MATWKYNRLPEEQLAAAQKFCDDRDLSELLYLHNTYKLSNQNYCCPDPSLLTFFIDLLKQRSDTNNPQV